MTVDAGAAAQAARLILASASPRRKSLLRDAGYQFDIYPSAIDEQALGADLGPSDLATRLALAKAQAVWQRFPDMVVLGADTVVAFGERILGKPIDEKDARRMLYLLAGTTHIVITGVAIARPQPEPPLIARVMSAVRMKGLSRNEVERYLATNEWQGKAGGYGIQDADPFVARVAGCHTNIVGLPMTTTRKLLDEAGVYPKMRPKPPSTTATS
jgi:septum formation protein